MTTTTTNQTSSAAAPKRRGCLFFITRGLIGLVLFIVGLLTLAFIVETVMQAGDAERYPAPGQLVDVEGYTMHIYCVGEGSPTIILESGAGGLSLQHAAEQEQLRADSRVCAYDRAGMGWSEARPEARTPWQIVHELHTLLQNAAIEPPYILVGPSNGGLYVRAFAAEFPDETAGLVLLDPTDEASLAGTGSIPTQIYVAFGRLGFFRLFSAASCPSCSPQGAAAMAAQRGYEITWKTYAAEWAALQAPDEIATMRERMGQAGALGDLPLFVIAANQSGVPLAEAPTAYQAAIADEQNSTIILSTNHRYVIVMSDHGLSDQQDLILAAIRNVLTAARTGEPLP